MNKHETLTLGEKSEIGGIEYYDVNLGAYGVVKVTIGRLSIRTTTNSIEIKGVLDREYSLYRRDLGRLIADSYGKYTIVQSSDEPGSQ